MLSPDEKLDVMKTLLAVIVTTPLGAAKTDLLVLLDDYNRSVSLDAVPRTREVHFLFDGDGPDIEFVDVVDGETGDGLRVGMEWFETEDGYWAMPVQVVLDAS